MIRILLNILCSEQCQKYLNIVSKQAIVQLRTLVHGKDYILQIELGNLMDKIFLSSHNL